MSQQQQQERQEQQQQVFVATRMIRRLISFMVVTLVVALVLLQQHAPIVDGFIKFGYILNTTACDVCDELSTYSGRNVFCCLAQSKCCGPNSLDELEAALTTVAP